MRPPKISATAARRIAGAAAIVSVAFLAACTPSTPKPVVTGAPEITKGTVRVGAVVGDLDAQLQAEAVVLALRARGFDAQLSTPRSRAGWGTVEALEALEAKSLEVFVTGAAPLAAQVPATAASSSAGGAGSAPASSNASEAPNSTEGSIATATEGQQSTSGTSEPAVPVPTDASAAITAAGSVLPDGSAVASTSLGDRRLALAVAPNFAGLHTLRSVSDAAKQCPEAVLAATTVWAASWKAGFGERTGCVPERVQQVTDTDGVISGLLDGSAQIGVVHSSDPELADDGVAVMEDPDRTLAADPLISVVDSRRVGQDAIDVLNKVAGAASPDEWSMLRRLDDGVSAAQRQVDLREWMLERGVIDKNASTPSPTGT